MTTENPTPSPKQLFDLSGKVALVTGASRGIGESIAKTLGAYGAHVIVSSRKTDGCERVVAEIKAAGGSAEVFACHIGEMAQIDAVFAHIEQKHGRLDILINNAAANPYFGPIADTDVSAFQKTVDVNIRGYFFMSTAGYKLMKKNGGGAIVNTASVNGVIPGPYQGIYSITKAAVISMTHACAKEWAPDKVRVNALLPGITDTKFASALVNNPQMMKVMGGKVPMSRVAHPDEMAAAVLYLVSPGATYTTGVTLNVDGGYLTA